MLSSKNLQSVPVFRAVFLGAFVMLSASACVTGQSHALANQNEAGQEGAGHDVTHEARPYDKTRDAKADVAQALREASEQNKHALIVMGANWCHDSRALAGHFETERYQTLLAPNYVLLYVDVGQKDRNIEIAKQFGLEEGILGTPTVIITDSEGQVLNLDTAPTWRNAASRTDAEIFEYFESFSGVDTVP